MRIRRGIVEQADHFTIIPNEWLRDKGISRRARGLLAELLSHQEGWEVSVASLCREGTEGRDAIRTALSELENAGYLVREEKRDSDGKFEGVDFVLTGEKRQTRRSEPTPGKPSPGYPSPGYPSPEKPDPKKTISKKTNYSEHQTKKNTPARSAGTNADAFAEFWAAYPKKVAKKDAERAFNRAAKRYGVEVLLHGVRRFVADPNLPEKRFIPNGATWINGERWKDEPYSPSAASGQRMLGSRPEDWLRPAESDPGVIDVFEYEELA